MIRPGLVKARERPLVLALRRMLVRTSDPRWRELLARADVVSEGDVRDETDGRMWYGTTSLILPTSVEDTPLLAALAARDVHLRLRALRTAHREASLRAPCRLGRLSCEVRITSDPAGVRIDVEVQAPLVASRRKSTHHRPT